MQKNVVSRRNALKAAGVIGASAFLGTQPAATADQACGDNADVIGSSDVRKQIFSKVLQTPLIDTHEHLVEESERLGGRIGIGAKLDDWSVIFRHYLNSDMLTAGMSKESYDRFFSHTVDPISKWPLIEPVWPAVKNTGYGRAVRIAMRELYGVDELSAQTVEKVQAGYEQVRKPGFYKTILCDRANIESCQVNCLNKPFEESAMPEFLMQDLSIVGMFAGPDLKQFGKPTGLKVTSLEKWHGVIDWWFDKYGKYAVAAKSQNAYDRDIDYEQTPADKAEPLYAKKLASKPLNGEEKKMLEDHLFWYAVNKATEHNLPVKLHTGYYAGENYMPLNRLIRNPGAATDLCRRSANTRFVFMHICYPYYEEILSVAKHYTNAYIDMCWSWIINPVAAKDFLKKYLVTAPANKILTFGGDYSTVEPVLGHAAIARRGIAIALSELVEEGWLGLNDAIELVDPIMHGNARTIFNLERKTEILRNVKWT